MAVFFVLTPGILAQPATWPTNAPHRYLLIVDTSFSMRSRSEATKAIVQDLLISGMNGESQRGDSLGVWTFNERLYTGQLPLQRWTRGNAATITGNTLEFLKKQRYQKSTDLKEVLRPLLNLVSNSARLTIILISDGDEKIEGTPFDSEINSIYELNHKPLRKVHIPFTTVLRAERGKITGFTVNTTVRPIQFPPLPPKVEVVEKPIPTPPKTVAPVAPMIFVGKKTNQIASPTPAVSVEKKDSTPLPATNVSAKVEIPPQAQASVVTTVVQAPEIQTNQKPATTVSVPQPSNAPTASIITPIVPASQTTATAEPTKTAVLATPQTSSNITPAQTTTSAPVAVQTTNVAVIANQTKPQIVPAPSVSQTVAQTVHRSAQTNSPEPVAPQLATTLPPQRPNVVKTLAIALAAIAVLGLLLFLIMRRSRTATSGSLITRSLDQEKK